MTIIAAVCLSFFLSSQTCAAPSRISTCTTCLNVNPRCPLPFVLFVLVVQRCPFKIENQYQLSQVQISAAHVLRCPFKTYKLHKLAQMSIRIAHFRSFCLSRLVLSLQFPKPVPTYPNVNQRCYASVVLFVLAVFHCPFKQFNLHNVVQISIRAALSVSFFLSSSCVAPSKYHTGTNLPKRRSALPFISIVLHCPLKTFNLYQITQMPISTALCNWFFLSQLSCASTSSF